MRKLLPSVQRLAGVVGIVACRGATAPMSGDASPVDPVAASSAAPSSAAAPSAATPASSEAADAPARACLMVNVCSCNLGCASIQVAKSMLRDGTRAQVVTGPLRGHRRDARSRVRRARR